MEDARPAPHELWVRLDIAQGRNGYDRGPHLDHRRRLVSMLIYMCDADEIGLEGGELVLHGGRPGRPNPIGSATLRPRHNLMVGFACVPHSWHAVTKTTVTRGYRNFIQVQLSSSEDAWPA